MDSNGEKVAYCCLWYSDQTDYAYVEPVYTIPACRKKGIARTVVFEALKRAKELGARTAYVISDQDFYAKLGFKKKSVHTFYWKS